MHQPFWVRSYFYENSEVHHLHPFPVMSLAGDWYAEHGNNCVARFLCRAALAHDRDNAFLVHLNFGTCLGSQSLNDSAAWADEPPNLILFDVRAQNFWCNRRGLFAWLGNHLFYH